MSTNLLGEIGQSIMYVMTVLLTGDPNSSLVTLVIYYVGPILVLYNLIFDIVYLFGFFSKRTAQVVSIVFAFMIGRFGGFRTLVGFLMNATKFPVLSETGGGEYVMAMMVILVIGIATWIFGHFAIGYMAAKNVGKIVRGEREMRMIGDSLEKR